MRFEVVVQPEFNRKRPHTSRGRFQIHVVALIQVVATGADDGQPARALRALALIRGEVVIVQERHPWTGAARNGCASVCWWTRRMSFGVLSARAVVHVAGRI